MPLTQNRNKRNHASQDPVRNPEYRLNDEEKKLWAAAVAGAGTAAPVLLGALTMLQPYKSKLVDVAAIDPDWRVAVGNAFFQYTQREREAIVTHECLHVTCNHFARARIAGQADPEASNMAEDLEINQMVASLRRVKLPAGALYPNTPDAPDGMGIIDVPAGQQMEAYYKMISKGHGNDPEGNNQSSQAQDSGPHQSNESPGSYSNNDRTQTGNEQNNNPQSHGNRPARGDSDQSSNDGTSQGNGSSSNGGSQDDASSGEKNGPSSNSSDKSIPGAPGGRDSNGDESTSSSGGPGSGNGNGNSQGESTGNGSTQNNGEGDRPSNGSPDDKIHGLCGGGSVDRIRKEADAAGVRKVRTESKVQATESMINETQKRIKMNGQPGVSTLDEHFLVSLDKVIHPPRVSWRQLLRTTASDLVSKQAYQKTEYSFKRINRRGSAFMKDCAFPSMIGYAPIVMMAIDTSGSRVDGVQFEIDMKNASDILKETAKLSKKSFSAFCVDTDIKKIQPVNSIDELDFTGGGGTDMSVAFRYVDELPHRKRPDVFVLATDGGFDWDKCAEVWPDGMKVIILITDSWYLQPGKIPDWVYDEAKVIDCTTDER